MPDVDGRQVVASLRAIPRPRRSSCSPAGDSTPRPRTRSAPSKVDRLLGKPPRIRELRHGARRAHRAPRHRPARLTRRDSRSLPTAREGARRRDSVRMAKVRIGISGWRYEPWRKIFYPGRPSRSHVSSNSPRARSRRIEINGSFYSLQTPRSYAAWRDATPAGFVFSGQGTSVRHPHPAAEERREAARQLLRLRRVRPAREVRTAAVAVAAFDAVRRGCASRNFFALLPRDTRSGVDARALARCRACMAGRACSIDAERPLRHALEIRHESFVTRRLRRPAADSIASRSWSPTPRESGRCSKMSTADFMYLRLHGDEELYASGYTDPALDRWARTHPRVVAGRTATLLCAFR